MSERNIDRRVNNKTGAAVPAGTTAVKSGVKPRRSEMKNTELTQVGKKPSSVVKHEARPAVRTIKDKTRKPFPAATLFFMLICTMLVMFMVINYVQINEYTQEISDMKDTLTELQKEEDTLALSLEEKNDLRRIEEYAANELGMVSGDSLRRVYVEIDKEDTIDNYDEVEEDIGVIATVMNALGNNMRSYWNIFSNNE